MFVYTSDTELKLELVNLYSSFSGEIIEPIKRARRFWAFSFDIAARKENNYLIKVIQNSVEFEYKRVDSSVQRSNMKIVKRYHHRQVGVKQEFLNLL